MDAADHAGALFGALIVGVILVPVMGLFHTLWILAGLKGCVLLVSMSVGDRES
jgi:hypothetical protein